MSSRREFNVTGSSRHARARAHTHTHTHGARTHARTHKRTHAHTRTHVHTDTHLRTHDRTRTHTHKQARTHARTHRTGAADTLGQFTGSYLVVSSERFFLFRVLFVTGLHNSAASQIHKFTQARTLQFYNRKRKQNIISN